jgi:hypothetical protein
MNKKFYISIYIFLAFQLIHSSYLSQTFLTNAQVYDFEVGDVVQGRYQSSAPFSFGPPGYETKTIIGKEISQSLDTIYYTIKRDYYIPPACPTCSPTFSYDTIIQTITNLDLPANHLNETSCFDLRDTSYYDYCGREVWERLPIPVENCFEPVSHTTKFVAGVGGPFFTKNDPKGPLYTEFVLIYYSKDTVICGNLMVSIPELVENNIPLKIYPNPADENLFLSEIDPSEIGERAVIYDFLGHMIHEIQIESTNQKIDVSHFESGVYFLNILGRIGKFVIK